jgi:hypothetical protein
MKGNAFLFPFMADNRSRLQRRVGHFNGSTDMSAKNESLSV